MKLMLRWRPRESLAERRGGEWRVSGPRTGTTGTGFPAAMLTSRGPGYSISPTSSSPRPRRRPDLRVLADVGYLTADLVPRPYEVGKRGRV